MLHSTLASSTDNAGGVSLVYHGEEVIFFAQCYKAGQVHNVTVHAEYGIADDESLAARGAHDFRFQILHIVVLIDNDFCFTQACPVDDAGVVIFVAKDNAFAVAESGKNAHIGHVASIKE